MKVYLINVSELPKISEFDANIVTWGNRKYASPSSNDLTSACLGEVPETHFALTQEEATQKATELVKTEILNLVDEYKSRLEKLQSFLKNKDFNFVSLEK